MDGRLSYGTVRVRSIAHCVIGMGGTSVAPAAVSGRCMQATSRTFLIACLVQASFVGWLDCVYFQETCQFEGAEGVDERGKPGAAFQDGILGFQGGLA